MCLNIRRASLSLPLARLSLFDPMAHIPSLLASPPARSPARAFPRSALNFPKYSLDIRPDFYAVECIWRRDTGIAASPDTRYLFFELLPCVFLSLSLPLSLPLSVRLSDEGGILGRWRSYFRNENTPPGGQVLSLRTTRLHEQFCGMVSPICRA